MDSSLQLARSLPFGNTANAGEEDEDEKLRILRQWQTPIGGVVQADATGNEMRILLEHLPQELSEYLKHNYGNRLLDLNEIYLQLGQCAECIFADPATGRTKREILGDAPCCQAHIDLFSPLFVQDDSSTTASKRRGIENTLHRLSLVTHPARVPEKVIGVAVRVGRALQGLVGTQTWDSFLPELAAKKQSLLLVGRPGVGKTTVLREVARLLADDPTLNVVVVDKTCEIAGDGNAPHAAIGRARWMPVGRPNLQHVIMREAVENQSPDVILVDEISTSQEVDAARTIAQRGVMLIATVHGQSVPEIVNCRERGALTGGCATVTLSGREADRRPDKRKQVLKRAREPIFHAVLELRTRSTWIYHPNVKDAVDAYLDGLPFEAQMLRPGKAIAVMAIPQEGVFEYCTQCGLGTGHPCVIHGGTSKSFQPSAAVVENTEGPFAFGNNSQGRNQKTRRGNRKKVQHS